MKQFAVIIYKTWEVSIRYQTNHLDVLCMRSGDLLVLSAAPGGLLEAQLVLLYVQLHIRRQGNAYNVMRNCDWLAIYYNPHPLTAAKPVFLVELLTLEMAICTALTPQSSSYLGSACCFLCK